MFDVLIVGGGPAGITAAIYAKRAGRSVAIIEKIALGGQLNIIGEIENYPGFSSVLGPQLADDFAKHTSMLDIPVIYDEVVDFDFSGNKKMVVGKKEKYEAYSVILALGSNYRELNIDGEKKFVGSGVSYCAVCDGRFFKSKIVAVVGSGDSAISDALYLSSIAKEVHIVAKEELKMHNYTFLDINEKGNIFVHQNSLSKKIEGEDSVKSLIYDQDGESKKLNVDAVFVAVGRKPMTDMLKDKITLNKNGYIEVNDKMQTAIDGVYACGDITDPVLRQVSVAVGQGAIAGTEAAKNALKKIFEAKRPNWVGLFYYKIPHKIFALLANHLIYKYTL